MIDFLINLLQKVKSWSGDSNGQIVGKKISYSLFFLILVAVLIGGVRLLWNILVYLPTRGLGSEEYVSILAILLWIFGLYVYFRQRQDFFSGKLEFARSLFTVYIPWFFFVCFIFFTVEAGDFGGKSLATTLLYFPNNQFLRILFLVYPALAMLGYLFPSLSFSSFYKKLSNLFSGYMLGYSLIFSLAVVVAMLLDGGSFIHSLSGYSRFGGFLLLLFLVTFPLIMLRHYFLLRNGRGIIVYGFIFLVLAYLSYFQRDLLSIEDIISSPVRRSERIIREGGDNYTTYKKAQTFLLSKAYLAVYKRGYGFDQISFRKLFDAVPESYFGAKLGDTFLRNSRATNASKVGKNADVSLKLAEIENTLLSSKNEIDVLKTEYKFHMTNKTTTNQEVIIHFQTPSQDSVVTDLKLGLYGQMLGIIAPRGAATKVYEDSLRINRDPALLEKIGLNTYRLRVFPIPSLSDDSTQGRQLVQFTVLTPLKKGSATVYSPQISLINLEINEEASLISKIYKDGDLVHEDRIKNQDIDMYLSDDHLLPDNLASSVSSVQLSDYCFPKLEVSPPSVVVPKVSSPSLINKPLLVPPVSSVASGISLDKIGLLWRVGATYRVADDKYYATLQSFPLHLSKSIRQNPVSSSMSKVLCERTLSSYEATDVYADVTSHPYVSLTTGYFASMQLMNYSLADKICVRSFGSGWRFTRFLAKDLLETKTGETMILQIMVPSSSIPNDIYAAPFVVGVQDPHNLPGISNVDDQLLFYPLMNNEIRFSSQDNGNTENSISSGSSIDSGFVENEILSSGAIILPQQQQTGLYEEKIIAKSKTSIFFDTSLSVQRNDIQSSYGPLYDALKNYDNKIQDVDIFSFNFAVEKIVSVDDLVFWGYSDIDSVLDYIEKNGITNQRIVLVTDDDSFNFTQVENANRNFSVQLTNELHVIVLGDKIKTYKSDFVSLLAATRGTVHTISNKDQINSVLSDIFSPRQKALLECDTLSGVSGAKKESKSPEVQKILAGIFANSLMSSVKNTDDWKRIAEMQTLIAQKYAIVNQFNSMIALETDQQQKDLEKYQNQDDKYTTMYNNFGDAGINDFDGRQLVISQNFGGNTVRKDGLSLSFSADSSSSFFGKSSSPSYSYGEGNYYDRSRDINVTLWIILMILIIYLTEIYQWYLLYLAVYSVYFSTSGPEVGGQDSLEEEGGEDSIDSAIDGGASLVGDENSGEASSGDEDTPETDVLSEEERLEK